MMVTEVTLSVYVNINLDYTQNNPNTFAMATEPPKDTVLGRNM